MPRHAFPYAPLHCQGRSRLHNRVNTIRTLRNSVFQWNQSGTATIYSRGMSTVPLSILRNVVCSAAFWFNLLAREMQHKLQDQARSPAW